MKYILSLNGGGTSGYMTCGFLNKIVQETGINLVDRFDLIAGVSTGSLIGGLLCSGLSPAEIQQAYKEMHAEFGDRPKGIKGVYKLLFGSYYSNKLLKDQIQKRLVISDISDAPTKLMIHALRMNRPLLTPKFWKSWEHFENLADIITASSSAPVAFKPYTMSSGTYYDGGLVLNDPTLPAFAESEILWPGESKRVFSIQTDLHRGFSKPKEKYGALRAGKSIVSMAIDGNERACEYIANALLGNSYFPINPGVYSAIDSSDWYSMDSAVNKVWATRAGSIKLFLNLSTQADIKSFYT